MDDRNGTVYVMVYELTILKSDQQTTEVISLSLISKHACTTYAKNFSSQRLAEILMPHALNAQDDDSEYLIYTYTAGIQLIRISTT